MKTPLRGEMLRGADFIIGVVSASGSDSDNILGRTWAQELPAPALKHGH